MHSAIVVLLDRAMGCHLPYGITVLPATRHRCTLPGLPVLNPPAGRYSIYLPRRDGRLSWPRLPGNGTAGSLATSRSQVRWPNHHTTEPAWLVCSFVSYAQLKSNFHEILHRCSTFERSRSKLSYWTFSSHSLVRCLGYLHVMWHSDRCLATTKNDFQQNLWWRPGGGFNCLSAF